MFENILASLPAATPRSTSLLPGLRFTARPLLGALVPLVFILFFGAMIISIMLTDHSYRLTHGDTAAAAARILSVQENRGDSAEIRYAFTAAKMEYRGTDRLQVTGDAALRSGDTVPVTYLTADPAVNALSERLQRDRPPPFFLFLLFPLVPFAGFLSVMLAPLRAAFQARRLFRHGILAKAEILFVKPKAMALWSRSAIGSSGDVFLTYRSAHGERVEARVKCSNAWLLGLLTPGLTVHIAYLPTNPGSAILLEEYIR
jgi:hypothetical protein